MNSNTHPRPSGMPHPVAAAIFDFDETLIDLEPQHSAAYAALCTLQGSDYSLMPEEFRKGSGRRVIDDIHEMKRHFGWKEPVEDLFTRRQEVFERLCRESSLSLMDGAAELVRALSERNVRQAITTSAVRGPIMEILQRFDLLACFDLIVDGSEVTRGKPDPEPYLVTVRKLGLPAAFCIVFEDSNVGVRSAHAAGTWCIGIANPNAQLPQDLSAADLLLPSLRAFDPEWIEVP